MIIYAKTLHKITMYDLKSTNKNLRKIKEYFYENNISLLITRDIEEEQLPLSINSDTLLQLYCALYLEIPHKAKISVGKLIEDYYDDVYNTPNIHEKLLNTFKIYQIVKNKNKENSKIQHLKHSVLSLIYLMGLIASDIKNHYDEAVILKAYDKALNCLNKIVIHQQDNDQNYSNHNFFKSERSTQTIKETFEQFNKTGKCKKCLV